MKYQTHWVEHSEVKILSTTGKKHIALVAGGMSAEREVSLVSSEGVSKALIELGYKVTFIDMGADIAVKLQEIKPDIVFNCLHGTYGEDGNLPGLLNILRIPYTHSGLFASCIAFNKIYSKGIMGAIRDIHLQEEFVVINKEDNIKIDPIPRPYVIKPLTQGSSIGIEIVFKEDNFNFADYNFPYGNEIIVERYIKGRELQVALLNGKALGALEIQLLKNRFYDYETKYTEGLAKHLCPAPLTKDLYQKLLGASEEIYRAIGCRGVARAEFILEDQTNKLYPLEINTHPGMTPLSIVPGIAAYAGINFTNLIEEIIKTASFES
ncbi:D-alanine--D-alanine ligase [Rickettsia tillamookensis]|uniref:D-alanine--D-alanine ligase n=1 Tax=Rickettsia tillamookensis TaxID=2761623 RepID=A0A9E6MHA1_9RICK|nr:D-alanine--D-alanine ligase [Rickettsia tillamookensis]QQV74797.1 D-alanine--D-alanine ligase [Rickettsia tillamookensis]